jgi:hypothetical protein
MAQTFVKDPDNVTNFSIDWSDWLGSDTISTSTWTVPAGITEDSSGKTNTVATITLSSGTAGTTYTLSDRIVTAGGLTMDETLYIIVPTTAMYRIFRDLRDEMALETAIDDGQLYRKLEQALKAAESYCGRKFQAATATTRYYEWDAVDGQYLYLDDDLISIDTNGLTNGDSSGTTIPSTEYWLWPRQGGPPYFAIRLEAESAYSWEVDTDYMISVKGSWGWSSTIPEDVQRALMRWASYMYHQKDAPVFETTAFPDSGVISVPTGMPVDVKQLLRPYRRLVG